MVGFHTEECDKKGSHRQESLGGGSAQQADRQEAGWDGGG